MTFGLISYWEFKKIKGSTNQDSEVHVLSTVDLNNRALAKKLVILYKLLTFHSTVHFLISCFFVTFRCRYHASFSMYMPVLRYFVCCFTMDTEIFHYRGSHGYLRDNSSAVS